MKIVVTLGAIALLLAPVTSHAKVTHGSCVDLTREMGQGATDAVTGGEVSELQLFLSANAYLDSEPTGYFGPLTRAALLAFQEELSIKGNGTVGPVTRTAIRRESCAEAEINASRSAASGVWSTNANSVSFDFTPVSFGGKGAVSFSTDEDEEEDAPQVGLRLDVESVSKWESEVNVVVDPSRVADEVAVWELQIECAKGAVALEGNNDRCGDTIAVYAYDRDDVDARFDIARLRLLNTRTAKSSVKLWAREFDDRDEELDRTWEKVKLGAAPAR
jgi:hypothetical protein